MKKLAYLVPVSLLFLNAGGDQAESKRQGTDIVAEDSGQGFKTVAAVSEGGPSQETERQEIQRKVEARLTELSNRIKELKARAEKAEDKAKAELNEIIKELDKKMAAAKQQLEKFKSASAQAWEDAKSRTTTAVDDLEKTYDRAVKRIKKSV